MQAHAAVVVAWTLVRESRLLGPVHFVCIGAEPFASRRSGKLASSFCRFAQRSCFVYVPRDASRIRGYASNRDNRGNRLGRIAVCEVRLHQH